MTQNRAAAQDFLLCLKTIQPHLQRRTVLNSVEEWEYDKSQSAMLQLERQTNL